MAKLSEAVERFLSKEEVRMRINLKEIFGTSLPRDPKLRDAIAQSIIDKIVNRTQKDNKGWNGKPFTAYSPSYKKSDNFGIFGKSAGNVNMTLTGDMLGNMDISESNRDYIDISIDESDAPKAFNHVTGDTLPTRDFFGLSKSEMREIKSTFKDAVEAETRSARQSILKSLVAKLVEEGEGDGGQG